MKKIKITKGKFALVDDNDFDFLNQFKWSFHSNGYAVRTDSNNKAILMHRLLFNSTIGKDTDHLNRNKLDNRRVNLRIVSRSENMMNVGKRKGNKSGFKGVDLVPFNRWRAQIMRKRKNIHLGYFSTAEEAALAYNRKAKELFGAIAFLNVVPAR